MNIMVSGFAEGKPLKMKLIDWANARHKDQGGFLSLRTAAYPSPFPCIPLPMAIQARLPPLLINDNGPRISLMSCL